MDIERYPWLIDKINTWYFARKPAVGGIPDYIIDGETGFLINETEEENIITSGISKLNKLMENPDIKNKIQQNA